MGRGIIGVKKNAFRAAAVAGIVILLVFAVACSGDLLGYIKGMLAQAEYVGIELPKTGQTTLYETGDDGELQMGVAWPVPRFTVGTGAESVCITDNLTGLMWEQAPSGTALTWTNALTYANGLSLGGHSDWRLPNRKELRSLVNYEESDQSVWLNIPTGVFTGVQAVFYWSSTTYAPDTALAWYVSMGGGYVLSGTKTNDFLVYVLAVRSGQTGGAVSLPKTGQTTIYAAWDDGDLEKGVAWPDPRFADNGNGTICDNLTGLMWEQAPSGTATWSDALTYANELVLGGHSDWRLPNVNELESLINAGQADPEAWLNSQGLSGVQAGFYWSSTTYAPGTAYALLVSMDVGSVNYATKTGNGYVLAVRSGQ